MDVFFILCHFLIINIYVNLRIYFGMNTDILTLKDIKKSFFHVATSISNTFIISKLRDK